MNLIHYNIVSRRSSGIDPLPMIVKMPFCLGNQSALLHIAIERFRICDHDNITSFFYNLFCFVHSDNRLSATSTSRYYHRFTKFTFNKSNLLGIKRIFSNIKLFKNPFFHAESFFLRLFCFWCDTTILLFCFRCLNNIVLNRLRYFCNLFNYSMFLFLYLFRRDFLHIF